VEQRIPPSLEWVKLATDVRDTEFKVTKYNATKDHYFRVRAANEFGIAEPSMPAMMRKKEGIAFRYRNNIVYLHFRNGNNIETIITRRVLEQYGCFPLQDFW